MVMAVVVMVVMVPVDDGRTGVRGDGEAGDGGGCEGSAGGCSHPNEVSRGGRLPPLPQGCEQTITSVPEGSRNSGE